MMKIKFNPTNEELNRIDSFVSTHAKNNFFQSTKAFNFFNSVVNFDPILIFAEEEENIVGSLLAIIIKDGGGLRGYFSRRCIVWGGPIISNDDKEIATALLLKLNQILSDKVIYTEFRNFYDATIFSEGFELAGFNFTEHLNFIIATSSLDQVKNNMSKSKIRQIKKSLKNGATISEAESLNQIKEFYTILYNLYKNKVKKPLPSFDLFENFFLDKEAGKYFLINYNKKIIGGIMCPIYKDTIYELFVCGLDGQFNGVYPSILATWAPIEFASKNDLRRFDFMGAGKPDSNYGVREFKSMFGGELVNYGRFVKINSHAFYSLGKTVLKIKAKIKL